MSDYSLMLIGNRQFTKSRGLCHVEKRASSVTGNDLLVSSLRAFWSVWLPEVTVTRPLRFRQTGSVRCAIRGLLPALSAVRFFSRWAGTAAAAPIALADAPRNSVLWKDGFPLPLRVEKGSGRRALPITMVELLRDGSIPGRRGGARCPADSRRRRGREKGGAGGGTRTLTSVSSTDFHTVYGFRRPALALGSAMQVCGLDYPFTVPRI